MAQPVKHPLARHWFESQLLHTWESSEDAQGLAAQMERLASRAVVATLRVSP